MTNELKQRLQEAAPPAPSMVPVAKEHPIAPPPQEEKTPQLSDLISDKKDLLLLRRLIEEDMPWKEQAAEAAKMRKPLETKIKNILGKHKVGKALLDDIRVSYFGAERSVLDKELLLSNGVAPAVILASMKKSTSYTLRISKSKEEETED